MLSREQAGPPPAVSSNQAGHQVHRKVWRDPQHPQGESWLQRRVYFLSFFGTFLQLCSGSPHSRREEENKRVWLLIFDRGGSVGESSGADNGG